MYDSCAPLPLTEWRLCSAVGWEETGGVPEHGARLQFDATTGMWRRLPATEPPPARPSPGSDSEDEHGAFEGLLQAGV